MSLPRIGWGASMEKTFVVFLRALERIDDKEMGDPARSGLQRRFDLRDTLECAQQRARIAREFDRGPVRQVFALARYRHRDQLREDRRENGEDEDRERD